MVLDNRLVLIARAFFTVALLAAVGCMSGCGDYEVGPDPLPWNPPADPGPRSPEK
jgi:hypothetical protein